MAKKTHSKSEFIRNNIDLSAAEIVAKAKAAGHKITSDLVYKVKVRTKVRKRVNKAKAAPLRPAATTSAATTSKSSFIRGLPASMPAKSVVAAAAAQRGWKIRDKYVYAVRAATKQKRRKSATLKIGPRPNPAATPSSTASAAETTFRTLMLNLGLARSKALLGEVERKLGDIIAGR